MKRKIFYLFSFAFLLFLGVLAVDLRSDSQENLVTRKISNVALAFGCGDGHFNHHEGFTNGTVCYGSSGNPTDFTVLPYDDCRAMLNQCCAFPADAPQCPSFGG